VLMDASKTRTAGFGFLEVQLINQMSQLGGDKVTGTGGRYRADLPELPPAIWKEKEAEVLAQTAIDGRALRPTGLTRPFYFNRGLTAVGGGSPDPTDEPTRLACLRPYPVL